MPRVKIDACGVTVELDANEASHTDLADKALQVWRAAGGRTKTEGGPLGFVPTLDEVREGREPPHGRVGKG